ncbi:Intracellular protein transport protein USO1 [Golovinomyces cichoracearum]|uniref:Intracellular protein transport protein USO1 n=1 Tax=Golovinomyces cichoracearum TaxID=62708 RepID=A0A420ISC3_9PEZI|nr:Intracellular protein transport protein USO1 [Golovinomyces cichoracearum]
MFAIATPTKQTAEDTIITLSSRLSSATLLEDRRAAVLGLKSFSSYYPATVSSNALRGLIKCLDGDKQDVDTSLTVLQTLLQLFNPNESSPEASEEIALWVADEFTQRQENITLLLEFLETHDFYFKICSLKLLAAILSSRSQRTKELICTAPLGISKLVAVLDDKRDAIRNEGLSLLIYLTPNSTELQKRVTFEDAFDRIFNIINEEGSLLDGSSTVEDCLILLANLLRLNESNQTFFRETGFVPKIARLLFATINDQDEESEIADWVKVQRNRNLFALLAVLRLFLVTGNVETQANQESFWQCGVLDQALKLAFIQTTEVRIQAEALVTCADIIRGYPKLQEKFAQLQVNSNIANQSIKRGLQQKNGSQVYVIDALLDLTLSVSTPKAFDCRVSSCECLKAYLNNHSFIRQHFLRRAIDGYTKGEDVTPNFLTILLQPLSNQAIGDPYRVWFAAVIFFHLVFSDSSAKKLAMSVSEGDSANGEEVITCLQKLTGNLLAGIKRGIEGRILVAYLMLICGWLFEDPDSVNDFLGEGSHLQALVQTLLDMTAESSLVQGLCAMLLGILYEFSTKDSPVPRSTVHQILLFQLGRDKYIDRLSNLRKHYLLRDFEILPQKLSLATAGGLPEVFFDELFVEFTKDNFSRFLRALDRGPEYETSFILNGVQKGVSREMVDSLRSQLEEKSEVIERYQEKIKLLEKERDIEQSDHRKTKKSAEEEIDRIKKHQDLRQKDQDEAVNLLNLEHNRVVQDYKQQLEYFVEAQKTSETRLKNLEETLRNLNSENTQLKKYADDYLKSCDYYRSECERISALLQDSEIKNLELDKNGTAAREKAAILEKSIIQKETEKRAIQVELEDLLMVFTDLEEKVKNYKNQLRALGESVSDVEDG